MIARVEGIVNGDPVIFSRVVGGPVGSAGPRLPERDLRPGNDRLG